MIIMLTMTRLDDDDSGGSIPSILHDKWENMQRIKFWALLLCSSFSPWSKCSRRSTHNERPSVEQLQTHIRVGWGWLAG